MKKTGFIIALVCAAAAVSCSSTRQAVMSEAELLEQQHIRNMLENKLYRVNFTRAFPLYGSSFNLTYPYYISVIGGRVESFLPYAGRAYTLPYGGGEGLRFDAPITDYQVKEGRKGTTLISFDARTAEDSYTFSLEVSPSGSSYLTVSAMNKQSISFSGEIDPEPEFEVVRIGE